MAAHTRHVTRRSRNLPTKACHGRRVHHIRHAFASRALALGETLPVTGKPLGHSDIETTARYAHLAQDSLHETSERIAQSLAADVL